MTTFCPYCDEEIEDAIYKIWNGNYDMEFDFECPKCKKEIGIDVDMEPCFREYKKE